MAARFESLNNEELSKILSNKTSTNTEEATKKSRKIWINYLQEKGKCIDIDKYTTSELDHVLEYFYAEAKKKSGKDRYKKSSFMSIR